MIGMNYIDLLKDYPYLDRVKLGQIFDKSGENLNYLVKTLLQKKILISLKNGLFISQAYLLTVGDKEPFLEYLANILRYPSYISLEYACSRYGLIPEGVFAVTSVTTKTTRSYQTDLGRFVYRNITDKLFTGFSYVDFKGFKVAMARPGKALFDLLYFKKFPSMEELRINYGALEKKEKSYFEKLKKEYDR